MNNNLHTLFKGVKQAIRVADKNPGDSKMVEARVMGPFGVHKSPYHKGKFDVTHVPSGTFAFGGCSSAECKFAVVLAIETLGELPEKPMDFTKAQHNQIIEIRRLLAEGEIEAAVREYRAAKRAEG